MMKIQMMYVCVVVVVGWGFCLTRLILEIKSLQGDRQSDDKANTEELTTVTKPRHRNISTFFHLRQKCCDVDVFDIVTTLWFGTTNNITLYACHSANVNRLQVQTCRCFFF